MSLLSVLLEIVGVAVEAAIEEGAHAGRHRRKPMRPRTLTSNDVPRMQDAMRTFAEKRGMKRSEMAAWLGCSPHDLETLSRSRRPLLSSNSFREDVTALATQTGADRDRLAELLLVTPEM